MNEELKELLSKKERRTQVVEVDGYGQMLLTQLTAGQAVEVTMLMVGSDGKTVDMSNSGGAFTLCTCYALGYKKEDLPLFDNAFDLVLAVAPLALELSGINAGQKKA
jgi:hypothetical protein